MDFTSLFENLILKWHEFTLQTGYTNAGNVNWK